MNKIRHFLSITDLTHGDLMEILNLAQDIKQSPSRYRETLKGHTLAMIFQKPSTRTRVSFEVGMLELGGHALYLSSRDIQLGRGETIADTARVLSRYVSMIMARVFAHDDIVTLAEYATIPVINGLSDDLHPCQALADLLTILEVKHQLQNLHLAYVGDGNNVCHSLMLASALCGINIRVATPKGYEPKTKYVERARQLADEYGGSIHITHDPVEAVQGVDIVYTDVWASMGQESEEEQRRKIFQPYQVNQDLMERAKSDAIFMHCLPAHRGDEVTDDVIDGRWSVVWDQAENRLHAQKALLIWLHRNCYQENRP